MNTKKIKLTETDKKTINNNTNICTDTPGKHCGIMGINTKNIN